MATPKYVLFGLLSILFVCMISTVLAVGEPGGANVTLQTDQGVYPTPAPQSINVTGGNITLLNLSTESTTIRWVGLYGNVSGTINLGDSGNFVLYRWQAQGRYVFASMSNNIDWTNISPANTSSVLSDYVFLSNGTDNYSITFSNVGNITSEIIGDIDNISYAYTLNSSGSDFWETYALQDTDSDTVFMGVVNQTGAAAYNNETVNYQMIIPENGVLNNNPTEYYLWVELT